MDGSGPSKITHLKALISALNKREKTLREIINSTLTAPDIRESAKAELTSLLEDMWRAATEIERLDAGAMAKPR